MSRPLFLFLLFLLPVFAGAHPGNTNVYGQHICWLGYYECASWGEYYGTSHYHSVGYNSSAAHYSPQQIEELAKQSETYKNIKNGYEAWGSIVCDDGYNLLEEECVKPKATVLNDNDTSVSSPANNQRVRFENALKRGRYAVIEDLSDSELESYSEIVLEHTPETRIKEFAPDWFVEKFVTVSVEPEKTSREELLRQIQELTELLLLLKAARAGTV